MSYINPGKYRFQKTTYWSQATQDGFGGETWAAPIVIDCRWEVITDEMLSIAYRASGEDIVSRSVVYTPYLLEEGGYLYLGQSVEANPSRLQGAFVIRTSSIVPSVRNENNSFVAYL